MSGRLAALNLQLVETSKVVACSAEWALARVNGAVRRVGGGIAPVFPQQSIREMARTNRTPTRSNPEAYADNLERHFVKHLQPFAR